MKTIFIGGELVGVITGQFATLEAKISQIEGISLIETENEIPEDSLNSLKKVTFNLGSIEEEALKKLKELCRDEQEKRSKLYEIKQLSAESLDRYSYATIPDKSLNQPWKRRGKNIKC